MPDVEIPVEGILQRRHIPALDHRLCHMGASDRIARRQLDDLTDVKRETESPELFDHPMHPPDSITAGGGQKFGQLVIGRINEMTKDVNLKLLRMGGDFDACDDLQSHPFPFSYGRRQPLERIVIGDGQDGNI
ncbi:MAG: hypothetical protein M5R38_15310 [Candidatus Methylomirabilis sp.]|nr:hypothetical protein [Candidatus Methylomirabilis sp.]